MPSPLLKNNFFSLFMMVLIFMLATPFCHSAAFQNGDFEQTIGNWQADVTNSSHAVDNIIAGELNDITGWTTTVPAGNLEWCKKRWISGLPQSGVLFVIFGTGSHTTHKMEQTFDTVAGTTYNVSYYTTYRSGSAPITITIKNGGSGGTTLGTHASASSLAQYVWQQKTFSFTATSTSSYISLELLSSVASGIYIDNISITEVTVSPPAFSNTNSHVYPLDTSNELYKAIPGQTMVFDVGLRNTGGSPDASPQGARTFYFIIGIPQEIAFRLGSIVYTDDEYHATATGNPATAGGTSGMDGSTMLCCGTSGDIEYSTVAGTAGPWSTSPPATSYSDGGFNYTNDVRAIRISPRGTFADGSSTPTGFRVYYMGQLK